MTMESKMTNDPDLDWVPFRLRRIYPEFHHLSDVNLAVEVQTKLLTIKKKIEEEKNPKIFLTQLETELLWLLNYVVEWGATLQ